MKVVMVSKVLVVGAYQRKAEEIAKLGVELTVLTPPYWEDSRGRQEIERIHTRGYTLRTIPTVFNGRFHTHFYPTLLHEISTLQPDLLHMDEEPYNFATWLALRAARWRDVPALFFAWQNIPKNYPPPFLFFEKDVYKIAAAAIAGNQAAHDVLRAKGYDDEIVQIPQFGVDPTHFQPSPTRGQSERLRIGYAGGLLHEKGIDLLLCACAKLSGDWSLSLIGTGDQQYKLEQLARSLGIEARVEFVGRVGSTQMPQIYQQMDLLVLPSRTLPGWKEQFGRVLIEAMASEVVVIGSDSGEIPNVIGDAGLIFAEERVDQLHAHLQQLIDQPAVRQRLAKAGRQRVLANFSMQQIAEQTVDFYARIVGRAA